MLKVILGKKGTGKTKALIEMVNKAAAEENGNRAGIGVRRQQDGHYPGDPAGLQDHRVQSVCEQ